MRTCADCHKPDAPWFTGDDCTCGVAVPHDDDPRPERHAANCRAIGHEVVRYPVRIAKQDLEMHGDQLALPRRYADHGWELMQNGMRWYRMKTLCRDCIGLEEGANERRHEYERLCKAARGEETMTYSQMLASQ